MKIVFNRQGVLILTVALIWLFLAFLTRVDLNQLPEIQRTLFQYNSDHPVQSGAIFFLVYMMVTAFSLPLASILTLGAGTLFGFWKGLVLVSFASSLGATLAFLVSRLFLRSWIQIRFGKQLSAINSGIEREGAYYLFGLRLSPILPFFLVNFLMGLTPMPVKTFYWISQLGMLPGTALYVNVGSQLSKLEKIENVLSLPIVVSFTLIGLFPIIAKKIIKK